MKSIGSIRWLSLSVCFMSGCPSGDPSADGADLTTEGGAGTESGGATEGGAVTEADVTLDGHSTAGETSASDDTPTTGGSEAAMRILEVVDAAAEAGFSGSLLVRFEDELVVDAGFGYADREAERPNMPDTVFDIGSLTKQLTGAAIVALADRGDLGLEDTLADHFAMVPPDKAGITIHELLTHTAGFVGALGSDQEVIEIGEYLERLWSSELIAEPGTEYHYSNVGYSVLAAILEQISGTSYDQVISAELFTPAGMSDTGYLLPQWPPERIAIGYLGPIGLSPFDIPWADDGPYWHLRGNGGVLSTTADLLRWHDALAEGTVLDAEATEIYQTPYVDEGFFGHSFYAYGWVIEPTPAGDLIWHDGGNGFFFAEMLRFVEADLVIIMLANEESAPSLDLTRDIAMAALPVLEDWDPV